ncbi:uncharacterized protein LOC130644587 isoform X1 [Hydractinia symbiolongicarpus]|uniref:uncharacterized protein LOC130644587 isoform X1 n=2 Tax=Hydractinia symbiolongicarpus TaxID=13093 RepID=UPI00254ECA5E|nr:uncharacterized protein LOC130644587 isoform X1 [Hydractinia symbiolongicarpus]
MKLIFVFMFCVSFVFSLSETEIKNLKKELDEEMTKLESAKDKKSVDNNQIATVVQKDDDIDGLLTKLVLTDDLRSGTSKRDDVSIEYQSALNSLLKHFTKKKKHKTIAKETEPTKKSSENADEALLKMMIGKEKSKKETADDDFIKLLLEKDKSEKRGNDAPCRDEIDNCEQWKPYCATHKSTLERSCSKTCEYCKTCKKDTLKNNICKRFEKFCKRKGYVQRLKDICHETCGYCRVAAPPACQNDPMGCCWDGKSFASQGCRPCQDSKAIPQICRSFASDCKNEYSPGKYMRKHCPVTCGVCDPAKTCHDFPNTDGTCKRFKAEGKCSDSGIGNTLCPQTCGNCPIFEPASF